MKAFVLLLISFLLIACSSNPFKNPMGTISVRSVDPLDGSLKTPLVSSKALINDKNTIYKTEQDGSTDGKDVYAIYLTDSYLKYLSDFWGINEVIFVVEFTEAVTGKSKNDTTTKILGPYGDLADGIKAPLLNKALYGPKKMESDLLTMNIKVYEYDLEENDESSAFLSFIGTSAESFSLSDPITLGEIKLAKEIANSLIRANENDLVMSFDMDFVAGNAKYSPNNHSKVLPLKDGEIVIVKQEGCHLTSCSNNGATNTNNGQKPQKPLIDSPDAASRSDFIDSEVKITAAGLVKDTNTLIKDINTLLEENKTYLNDSKDLFKDDKSKKTAVNKLITNQEDWIQKHKQTTKALPYKDKTWLRLNIVKGGDPSRWMARKALYPSAEEIDNLLKNPYSLKTENLDLITQGIKDAQQNLVSTQAVISLSSETSYNNIHFIDKDNDSNSSNFCVEHSDNIKVVSLTYLPDSDNQQFTISPSASPKSDSCYSIKPEDGSSTFVIGSGKFIVNYDINGIVKVQSFPYLVRNKLEESDFTLICSANTDNTSYQLVLKPKESSEAKIPQITNIIFGEANQDIPFTATDTEIKTNRYFDKKESLSIKVEDVFGASIEPSISLEEITACLTPT